MVVYIDISQNYRIFVISTTENGSRAAKNNSDFPWQENNMDFSP